MIGTKIFRKHYFISSIILLLFIFLGFFSSFLVIKLSGKSKLLTPSPVFFAKLIDKLGSSNRPRGLEELEAMNDHTLPFEFYIVDHSGMILSPGKRSGRVPHWDTVPLPKTDYEFTQVKTDKIEPFSLPTNLVRFSGSPTEYLYISFMPPPHPNILPVQILTLTLTSLVVSILLGIGFALVLLFRSLREKVALADSVISELQKGNLKARFPIKKMDEVGEAMTRFNRMAEEIERLVEQLKSVEKSRMNLLQELAHDLRTPIASLKNLLETLSAPKPIAVHIQEEFLGLALKEVDYFERLVEDLLILAQVSEPKYNSNQSRVNLSELLEEEAESIALQNQSKDQPISLVKNIPHQSIEILGDVHLLRRMLRNVIENAFSFAKSRVEISINLKSARELEVTITDDGEGFSKEMISSYGYRRMTRVLEARKDQDTGKSKRGGGRLSVGLGSVIIKSVAQIHGGRVEANNRLESDPDVRGALVRITIPI